MLLGFSGKAGSGKDTAAEFLKQFYFVRTAYADPLKDYCMIKFNLSYNDVYTQEGKAEFNPTWGMTHREIIQLEGTEHTKPHWGKDFWTRRWLSTYNEFRAEGYANILVSDVRFDEEAEQILSLGGKIIEIERDDLKVKDAYPVYHHASEQGISRHLISHTIKNNSTLAAFEKSVVDLYKKLKNEQ